jgi:hypothetical protein
MAGDVPLVPANFQAAISLDVNMPVACRDCYYQHLEDLAQSPTEARLLFEVITQCVANAVAFPTIVSHVVLRCDLVRTEDRIEFPGTVPPGAVPPGVIGCGINLRWDPVSNWHMPVREVMLARDFWGNLRFVGCEVQPPSILGHELGHFLRVARLAGAPLIAFPALPGFPAPAATLFSTTLMMAYNDAFPIISNGFLNTVIGYMANPIANRLFIDQWSSQTAGEWRPFLAYAEFVNILPLANMLGAGNAGGVALAYSDGIAIGEARQLAANPATPPALAARIRPVFFNLANPAQTLIVVDNPHPQTFIRWAHVSAGNFWVAFQALQPGTRAAFVALVANLVGLITNTAVVPNAQLTVAALPRFVQPGGCLLL